ncbi:MAG: prepilin-type N-terminal cleavage/methylation domain-containing protein [Planctomycetota bacterium]|nr:prepilin-type N-terminal cleavage/methylation domain-containing protein [Planctomycetota bacterium]
MRQGTEDKGFTILEILLAVVILTVGLLGLLAVFPVAMRSGKQAVETTNAVIITHSVEQAIREGLRERKRQSPDGKWTYFIFSHDGVVDPLPTSIKDARTDGDYYILLPSPDPDRKSALNRADFYERGQIFIFPESDGTTWEVEDVGGFRTVEDETSDKRANGRGNPTNADDDGDDRKVTNRFEEYETYDVRRVYRLSNNFFDAEWAENYDVSDDDPISQYSFAFSIRPARQDGSLDFNYPTDSRIIPAGDLYEVDILVFRAFREGTTSADNPIYETQILVHR